MATALADVLSSATFLSWLFALFASWGVLSVLLTRLDYFKEKPGTSAHQIVVLAPFLYLAVDGVWMWFFDPDFRKAFRDDKVFGSYAPAFRLVLTMFAFQIWDFTVTLVCKDLRAVQHLMHHGVTALLSLSGLLTGPDGFLLYFAAYFLGVSEVSSVPLALMDLFKQNKTLAADFPVINEMVRVSFAVLFLVIRCCYWPFVMVDFWRSSFEVREQIPTATLILWYVASLGLTCLQYFWGSLIVKGVIKMVKGDRSRSDAAREATAATACLQEERQSA